MSEKKFSEMSLRELVNHFAGRICVGIGAGDFRGEVINTINVANSLGYARGQKSELEAIKIYLNGRSGKKEALAYIARRLRQLEEQKI